MQRVIWEGVRGGERMGRDCCSALQAPLPCSEHTGLGICTIPDTITSLLRSAGILSRLCRPCQGVSHEMQNPSEKERCKMDWRRQRISRARNEHEWLLSLFSLPLPLIFIVSIIVPSRSRLLGKAVTEGNIFLVERTIVCGAVKWV